MHIIIFSFSSFVSQAEHQETRETRVPHTRTFLMIIVIISCPFSHPLIL